MADFQSSEFVLNNFEEPLSQGLRVVHQSRLHRRTLGFSADLLRALSVLQFKNRSDVKAVELNQGGPGKLRTRQMADEEEVRNHGVLCYQNTDQLYT